MIKQTVLEQPISRRKRQKVLRIVTSVVDKKLLVYRQSANETGMLKHLAESSGRDSPILYPFRMTRQERELLDPNYRKKKKKVWFIFGRVLMLVSSILVLISYEEQCVCLLKAKWSGICNGLHLTLDSFSFFRHS